MPITPTYVWRVVARALYGGVTTINHAWTLFQEAGAPGATPNAIAVDFRDNVLNNGGFRSAFHTQLVFQGLTVSQLAPDPTTEQAGLSFSIAGTAVVTNGILMPAVVAAVTTWRTDRPGRSGRGRTYWVGIGNGLGEGTTVAVWGSAIIVRMELAAQTIANRYTLGANPYALQLGVWSRSLAGSGYPVPTTAVARVTSRTNQNYICTMGSRRFGHGI